MLAALALPSIVSVSLMVGKVVVSTMVQTFAAEQPTMFGMLNVTVSAPLCAFAALMASRKVQSLLAMPCPSTSQNPSSVSALEFTTKLGPAWVGISRS